MSLQKEIRVADQQIVVFRALQLGDLLCAIPALRALRALYPQAGISLVGLPWAQQLLPRFSHYLDEVIAFPGFPGLPEQPAAVAKLPEFLARIQARGVDLAIQLHGSGGISNPLVHLFGARRCAGFYPRGGWCPDPQRFWPYPDYGHEIHRNLSLMAHLGAPEVDDRLEFPLLADDFAELQDVPGLAARAGRPYVCLHPGARDPAKRWPPAHFAAVGDYLAAQGWEVVITGSGAEHALGEAVKGAMRAPACNAACDISVGALAALLSQARLLVANDTGVSHIAAALGVPSVIIFFATDPERWAPLARAHHRILENRAGVDPRAVMALADELLAAPASPASS